MEYRKFGDTYVIRMDRGEEVSETLLGFCEREGVTLASVQAIGAADRVVVGLYDVSTWEFRKQVFEEPLEITSLLGNVSTMDGKAYQHLHVNLARADQSVVGGHLVECRLSATCEMFVRSLPGTIGRERDEKETGLNLYRFAD